MPEVYFIERNGKRYAYKSTSRYDPEKKGPVSVNEYVGRVDEATGNIIPKKERHSDDDLGKMKMARFGGSYALLGIAETIGLRDDLFASFGSDGDRLLACAVAQALSGGPMSSVEDTADGTMIRELMGISKRFSSPRMSEFTKAMGDATGGAEDLFERRILRAGDALAYDITSVSTNSAMKGWGEWGHNRDNEKMRQANVGIVTDKKGVPAMFEMYPGSISDVRTLERTVDRIRGFGADSCTLVLDRGFGSAANIAHMIDSGISFVMPGKRGTKCVRKLMSDLIRVKGDADLYKIHERSVYSVIEASVAVVPRFARDTVTDDDDGESNDSADLELVTEDDPRFADVPPAKRIRAFVCHNGRRGAEDSADLHFTITEIEAKLKAMEPYAAVRDLRGIAGGYAKYLDCRVEGGKLAIERKRNSLSFSMNRAGMFVMFSRGVDSWEDMMSCYDCRTYVEQAIDVMKNELDGNRWRTSDPVTARGRLLIKFVSLMLWCRIASVLRSAGSGTPVAAVMQSLDNIMAIGRGDEWRLSEVTKKNRDWLRLLGLKEPHSKLKLGERNFIPGSYLH